MLVSMLCALIFLNAYPQNNKVDKEVNLSPVVVTGTGTHHRQTDSPVPVQVITQQDLLNINVSSLEELQKLYRFECGCFRDTTFSPFHSTKYHKKS